MNFQNESNGELRDKQKKTRVELRPRKNQYPGKLQEYKREYEKVSKDTKDQLCRMVQQGVKIVKAAELLGIKYATAKTVIFLIRNSRKQRKEEGIRVCSISSKKSNKIYEMRIISQISDRITHLLDHAYTLNNQTNLTQSFVQDPFFEVRAIGEKNV